MDTNESSIINDSYIADDNNATCHAWLEEALGGFDNVTLDDVNQQLIKRNIGGITLLFVLIVVGLVGNFHVLWIYTKQFKHSNYRVYVLWLAMLDILNCTVIAPMTIFYLFFPVQFPSLAFCKIFRFFLYAMAISSTSSLIVIAIDRYKKICCPLGKQFSTKTAKIMCGVSMGVAIILSWPAAILYGLATVPTGVPGLSGFRCYTADEYRTSYYQIIYNFLFGIYFISVSTTLIVLYVKIGRHIKTHYTFRKSIRRLSARTEEEVKKSSGVSAKKSTYTLFAVTVAYIVSALPHHLLAVLIFTIKDFDCKLSLPGAQLYYTFIWSYFFISTVNPFIYGVKDGKFWSAVKRLYSRRSSFSRRTESTEFASESTTTERI